MSLLISVALILIMVSLGLNLPSIQFDLLQRRPALLIRVLLTTCVGIPVAALILLRTPLGQSLSPAMATAVMLMAICPSAPMITRKSRQVAHNTELATRLQFWSACSAIISVPLWASQLPEEASETILSIPAKEVASQVLTVQLVPLLLGVSLRRWRSEWAYRWNPFIQKGASILLLLLLALILIVALPDALRMLIANLQGVLVMLTLTWIALTLGFVIASEDTIERSTLPLVLSMRNPGLALLLVERTDPGALDVKAAVVGYVVITAIGSVPFMRWRKAKASQDPMTTEI